MGVVSCIKLLLNAASKLHSAAKHIRCHVNVSTLREPNSSVWHNTRSRLAKHKKKPEWTLQKQKRPPANCHEEREDPWSRSDSNTAFHYCHHICQLTPTPWSILTPLLRASGGSFASCQSRVWGWLMAGWWLTSAGPGGCGGWTQFAV